nr:fructose-bisphosphatase class III [Lachnospiraceae bacterium]
MATYVISDIHGEYDMFMELLNIINFRDSDILYVLGDVFDRGPKPITALLKIMEMPNVICMVGNHEYMGLPCLEFLVRESTSIKIKDMDEETLMNFRTWQYNGSSTTIEEFLKLDEEIQLDIIDFIKDLSVYEHVRVGDKKFLLVHAGLGNY